MPFWGWIAVIVGAIFLLTWIGAIFVRKNPDDKWDRDEDKPMIGHDF